MPNATSDFAVYCCEILSSAGPCTARRMFGGWGISTDGLTIAIIANLGGGEKLWLKSDDASRHTWEAAGCERFTYTSSKGGETVSRGMNYYSAPEDAMDSIHAMEPWARMALQAALIAKNSKKMPKKAAKKTTRAKTPRAAG